MTWEDVKALKNGDRISAGHYFSVADMVTDNYVRVEWDGFARGFARADIIEKWSPIWGVLELVK